MPDIFVNKSVTSSHKKKTLSAQKTTNVHKETMKQVHSPVSAYCKYPANVKFVNADDEEVIVLLLRRHWITNLSWILTALFLVVAPVPFVFFPVLTALPEKFLVVGVLFWYLVTLAFILEKFLSWFFNVYIVTDERVFDVDFYNLVDRDISDANIEDIQDVTSSVRGAIQTWFDYGDVKIQTSAEVPEIEFEFVPHPDEVTRILRGLRVEEEQEKLEGRVR